MSFCGSWVSRLDCWQEETQVPSALIEAIPTKLNRVPHPRELRQHFYRMAKSATMGALDAGETRIQIWFA